MEGWLFCPSLYPKIPIYGLREPFSRPSSFRIPSGLELTLRPPSSRSWRLRRPALPPGRQTRGAGLTVPEVHGSRPARWEWAALAVLLAGVAVLALLRWTGDNPFGSDSDEYRMLAHSLWLSGRPVIDFGIEGTKYPLGYSFVLGGLAWIGLPLTATALVSNLALALGIVTLTWWVGRSFHRVGGWFAAALVAVSPSVWSSVYVVMPDLALVAVTLVAFTWLLHDERSRDVAVLTGLAIAAAALKTVGVVLGGALGVSLWLRGSSQRRWAWLPPLAGVVVTAVQALLVAGYPEHTTGYAATFWLRDTADASRGTIGAAQLPARMLHRIDTVLFDAGHALLGPQVDGRVAVGVVLVLLLAALVAVRRWRWPLLAYILVTWGVLAAWPYHSPRFGLPLVPLAAVGAAGALGRLATVAAGRRRWAGTALVATVAAAALVAQVPPAVARIRAEKIGERRNLSELEAAVDDLRGWAATHIAPGDDIASFDYRALAYRLDRRVLPLGYTTDPQALWAASGGRGADWLISIRGLYARRAGLTEALVSAYPDRFHKVYATQRIVVYAIGRP